MDRFSTSRGSGVLLFDEDFDLPPRSAEPEVIEPVYSAAELAAAREEAAQEGHDRAVAEVDASVRTAAQLALTQIATQLTAARSEMTAIAEQSSEAIARLLLDCFATAFPTLSTRHGPDEVTAVIRAILPALHREPAVTVRVNPHLVAAVTEEIRSLAVDMAAGVRLVPTDAIALGDARITWDNGAAIRDTMSLWRQIENVLAPAGLLHASSTAKEFEIVE